MRHKGKQEKPNQEDISRSIIQKDFFSLIIFNFQVFSSRAELIYKDYVFYLTNTVCIVFKYRVK